MVECLAFMTGLGGQAHLHSGQGLGLGFRVRVYLGIQKAEKKRPYGKNRFLMIQGRILGFKWFSGNL